MHADIYIHKRIATIKALRTLKQNVDPASGMSVCVRRGVLSDQGEDDSDRPHREWISLEVANDMAPIIDMLIASEVDSLRFWVRSGTDEAQRLVAADAAARQFLATL